MTPLIKPITPHLWFDTPEQVKAAVEYYVSVFPNSKIINSYVLHSTPTPGGDTFVYEFELNGQRFMAINGGDIFKFNEAVSFIITCETQAEPDAYWSKLSAVPASEQCGWCKDKFGLVWQITPSYLDEVMSSGDQAKINRVTQAFLPMKKIIIADLKQAAA
jgi:predicted 3-demethylubiquinone-9 3-methyltransferase (glyoxalase superfamily)